MSSPANRKKNGPQRSMLSKNLFQSLGNANDFLPPMPPSSMRGRRSTDRSKTNRGSSRGRGTQPQSLLNQRRSAPQRNERVQSSVAEEQSSTSSQKQLLRKKYGSSVFGGGGVVSLKKVTLQHYTNILRLIDGLKYQLPAVGDELHCSVFVGFMRRNVLAHQRRAETTSVLSMTGLLGEFVCPESYSSLSWHDIVEYYAYPLLALTYSSSSMIVSSSSSSSLSSTLSSFEHSLTAKQKSSVSTRLRCGLQINVPLRKIDKLLSNASRSDSFNENNNSSNNSSGHNDNDFDENDDRINSTTSVSSNRQILFKFLTDLQKRYTRDVQTDFDNGCYASTIAGCLSLSSSCPCCFYAPCLFLYCSSTDYANNSDMVTVDTIRELYQTYRLPCVLFDAAIVLCDQLTDSQFRQDFCLTHLTSGPDTHGDTFAHVDKSWRVLDMGFYKRLYVMHMFVSVLVNWLWTMQRTQHATLVDHDTLLDVPPINVMVARNMIDLLRSVDTIPLLLLEKMRKIVIHVV